MPIGKSKRMKTPPKPKKSTPTAGYIPPRKLAQQSSRKPKTSGVRRVAAPKRPKGMRK